MRALITGINGFVGGHLSNLLLKNGFEVYGTDIENKSKVKRVEYFQANIVDKEVTSNLIKKSRPELIFHLAAISSIKICKENPQLAKKVNVIGTANLLSACVKHKINPKILITSSAQVYGIPKYIPIDESHSANPINEYGKSKLEQEDISLKFYENHSLNVLISRSFNHIGPNQATGFVCSDLAKQIAEIEKGLKKPEILVGNLSSQRDFTDVRDVVRAYLLLLKRGNPGEIYNIGKGIGYAIKEILNGLLKKSTANVKVVKDKSLTRKTDIPVLVANNNKFVSLTQWNPKFSIDDSLNDILEYWRNLV
jgi:GDP-4-dehydro-6-deoxy-D-mannose reductase